VALKLARRAGMEKKVMREIIIANTLCVHGINKNLHNNMANG